MFSFLMRAGASVCGCPKANARRSSKKNKTKLVEQYGIVQREYVEVPDGLLAKTPELKKYFDASYEYVSSLKPKPTTKPKKVKS